MGVEGPKGSTLSPPAPAEHQVSTKTGEAVRLRHEGTFSLNNYHQNLEIAARVLGRYLVICAGLIAFAIIVAGGR